MCERRKVTKGEFSRFKKHFLLWQAKLGVPEYDVVFKQDADDKYFAYIDADSESCTATVSLCKTIKMGAGEWVKSTARHEALHLLLTRLVDCAKGRFVSADEIDREYERVVRILEKVTEGLEG